MTSSQGHHTPKAAAMTLPAAQLEAAATTSTPGTVTAGTMCDADTTTAAAAATAWLAAAEDLLEAWEDACRAGVLAEYIKILDSALKLQREREELLMQLQLQQQQTQLHKQQQQQLAELLLPDGANFRDQRGNSALHYAAANGCQELVVFLLNKGDREK